MDRTQERNQWAFDGIMDWLTRPNAQQCLSQEGGCVYYDVDTGNRCAIGGHIDLEFARTMADWHIGIESLISVDADYDDQVTNVEVAESVADYYEGVSVELLDRLQRLHDDRYNWDADNYGLNELGISEAAAIAEQWNLKFKYA